MRKLILILLVFWANLMGVYAQDNFPVTASATLLPAQTWSDIYSSDNFLRVTLLLKDNSKSNVPVFLKIKLERVGLIIQSKPDYVPTHPINLAFGVPQSLGGYELKEYFNPNNLEIEGLDESFLRNGGHLPDGFYTFSVTAFEFDPARGHRQVSNTGVGQMTIFLGLPPIITFPAEGQVISDAYPQSILFQWMPRATAAQNGTMGVLYEFKIFEVGDDEEPSEVVQAKQPILTESVQMPNLLYNTTKPSLIAGKRYAVQVQVQSADGSTSFQNNGYSQIVSFYYGQPCTTPENVTVSQTSTSTAKIEWTPLDAAQTYDISYRVAGGTWKTITSYFSPVNINKDQDYTEFKVRCNCSSSRSSSWADATAAASPNAKTVMTANAPVALMMAAPPNTTGQTPLDIVLNPLDITVSSQTISTDDQNTLLAKLNDPANIIPPKPCNMAARKSAADCNPDAAVNYQGNIDFIPIKGSEIFINGYSIVVSNVNGPAGEGLLFLPYLMKRIPVFWNGVTIKEGETTPKFGCITVGEVKAQGSQDGVLTQDLQRQVTQLLTQPGEFTGKFGEALDSAKAKAINILNTLSSGKTVTPELLGKYKTVCLAVQVGIGAWQAQIKNVVGSNTPSDEITQLLSDLTAQSSKFAELANCSGATSSSSGGQKDSRRFFRILPCSFSDTEPQVDSIKKEIENSKEIFKSPPDISKNCILKIADLKTKFNVSSNTFVTPDGGTITLNNDDEVSFYLYATSMYPNGCLIGFKHDSKNYIAQLKGSSSGGAFSGYVDYDKWKADGYSPNASFNSTAATTTDVWIVEAVNSTKNIFNSKYTPNYHKGITQPNISYIPKSQAEKCDVISGKSDTPPTGPYSKNLSLLQAKLEGLGDVIFKVTDKDAKISYVDNAKIYPPGSTAPDLSGKTVFEILEYADGSVDVNGSFKADPSCSTCASTAAGVLTAAIQAIKDQQGGKIDPSKNAINNVEKLTGLNDGFSSGIQYQGMSWGEFLTAIAKGYNEMLSTSKVPLALWQSDKSFPVKDPSAVFSGVVDGARDEVAGKADLVGLVLTVIANPIETGKKFGAFVDSLNWKRAGDMVGNVAGGLFGYDNAEFQKGAEYSRHATGKVGGTLAVQVATGGLILSVLNGPKKLQGILTLFSKLRQNVQDLLKNFSDKTFAKFSDDLSDQSFLDWVNDPNNFLTVKGFLAYKDGILTVAEKQELAEMIAKGEINHPKAQDWLNRSENISQFQDFVNAGIAFEKSMRSALTDASSAAYQ